MKDETIDEKIERLEGELKAARLEKKNNLLKPGTKVFVAGEIQDVDAKDVKYPYAIYFKNSNEYHWFNADDVMEAK